MPRTELLPTRKKTLRQKIVYHMLISDKTEFCYADFTALASKSAVNAQLAQLRKKEIIEVARPHLGDMPTTYRLAI